VEPLDAPEEAAVEDVTVTLRLLEAEHLVGFRL
jgi:hypothetical protein